MKKEATTGCYFGDCMDNYEIFKRNCLLINERNAFSEHNKKAFADSSEKPITKRIINFIPSIPKPFPKIRGAIAKKHCTKKNFVIPLEVDEMGEAKINNDGIEKK